MMQGKLSERNVQKIESTGKIYEAVSRKETLGRILLADKNVPSAFYERHKDDIQLSDVLSNLKYNELERTQGLHPCYENRR